MGSDREVKVTHWWVYQDQTYFPVYAGGITLASIPTAHLIQDHVLGLVVLLWLGALLPVRAFFLCRPPYTVLCPQQLGGPIRPLCDNAEQFLSVIGPTT